jgi:general secretion pathway protein F
MAAFDFVAISPEGQRSKGVVQADSSRHARQLIRERGLYPVTVESERQSNASGFNPFLSRLQLSHLELSEFTRQFAVLLEAGIPIDEALAALASQSGQTRVKRCALRLRSLLMEGHSLSDAMGQQPRVFSRLYRAMVSAGEQSGALGAVLERLADYLDSSRSLKNNIRMALAYPLILSVVAVGVIFVLMSYVVPKIVDQFNHANQSLPALTELLINISQFLNQYWMLLLLMLAFIILCFGLALKNTAFSYRLDQFLLNMPLLRHYIGLISFARLARTLNILLSSGINLLDALRVSVQVVNNVVMREQLLRVHAQVEQGAPLAKALSAMQTPPMLMCLIENGERSGRLESAFGRAASMMESSLEERIKFALTLFEPLLILVMGGCVLGIVLAILLPILELNNMTLI